QNAMSAGAFDARAHGREAAHEIDDLRIARGIEDLGLAAGEARCHQRRLGGADGRRGKDDMAAGEPVAGDTSADVAALHVDLRAEGGERLEMQVDWARADGAAAG